MEEEPPIYLTRPKELHSIVRVLNSLALAGIFFLIASASLAPTSYVKRRVNALGVLASGPDGSLYEHDWAAQFRHEWPVYLLLAGATFFVIRAFVLFFRPAASRTD